MFTVSETFTHVIHNMFTFNVFICCVLCCLLMECMTMVCKTDNAVKGLMFGNVCKKKNVFT